MCEVPGVPGRNACGGRCPKAACDIRHAMAESTGTRVAAVRTEKEDLPSLPGAINVHDRTRPVSH